MTEPTRPTVPAEIASAPPSAHIGKFIRAGKLGAGGMGEVWKAWDTELARWVALKFLKGPSFASRGDASEGKGDDEEFERFRREAQIAGRLDHPNIAAIYEIGGESHRPFIAMQYVEGTTLRGAWRTCVPLVRDAARALQAAHDQGVIHRDLKPENLMIQGGRIFVMDFGLARSVEASNLTTAGMVVGTPNYMPPEQARGERVDARADVYSLGATLYAVLTGRAPFSGSSVYETLVSVIQEEPPLPRALAPSIPADLEAVVVKAMEKSAAHRYQTMGEFADDLDRWLGGEPVNASRAGLGYVLRKKASRVKVLLLIGAAALGIAAGVGGLLRWRLAAREAEVAAAKQRVLDELRTTARLCLEAALELRRAANLEGMRGQAAALESLANRAIAELPASPEPHYHLGRLYRAQMRWNDALSKQEEALRRESAYAPALYERLVLHAQEANRLGHVLVVAAEVREGRRRQQGGTAAPVPDTAALLRADPHGERLVAAMERDVAALGMSATDCARGLLDAVRGQVASAVRRLQSALEDSPDLTEAIETLAMLSFDPAEGGSRAARHRVALTWWIRGAERDRGYVPFLEGRAEFRALVAYDSGLAGLDPLPEYRRAVDEYDSVVALDPANGELLRKRAALHITMAIHAQSLRGDPAPSFAAAERDLAAARAAGALPEKLHQIACTMYARWGQGLESTDMAAALTRYERAMEEGNAAIRCAPRASLGWIERGYARYHRGLAKGDPGDFDGAIVDFTEALGLEPDAPDAFAYRAAALVSRAIVTRRKGGDPTVDLEAAAVDATASIELDARREDSWSARARARGNLASYRQSKGDEAVTLSEGAVADYTEAIRLNPAVAHYWHHRGNVKTRRADFQFARRQDPRALFREGVLDYTGSLKLAASDTVLLDRARAQSRIGDVQLAQGEDVAVYGVALADYREVMKRAATAIEVFMSAGRVAMAWAQGRATRGEDAAPALEEAVACWGAGVERAPSNGQLRAERGSAWFALARLKEQRRLPAAAEYRAALGDFTEGAKLDPRLKVEEGVRICRAYLEAHRDE